MAETNRRCDGLEKVVPFKKAIFGICVKFLRGTLDIQVFDGYAFGLPCFFLGGVWTGCLGILHPIKSCVFSRL